MHPSTNAGFGLDLGNVLRNISAYFELKSCAQIIHLTCTPRITVKIIKYSLITHRNHNYISIILFENLG
jgi:hypothetical protein